MKKILSFAAVSIALCSLFVSCASSGAKKSGGALVPTIPHPRSYVVDLADSTEGTTVELAFNQYGPNYQSTPNLKFTKFIKADKPQAGDTVVINYKFTCDIDLPVLLLGLVDGSAKANYWTNLLNPSVFVIAEDVKAGEVIEGSKEVVLSANVLGDFQVYIQYDSDDSSKMGYPKISKAAKLTFEDVEGVDTTDVEAELAASGVAVEGPKGPQTYDVAIEKYAAFCEIKTDHPWIDGKQDMSQICGYAAAVSIVNAIPNFDDPLPAGTKLHVTWHGVSDIDIPSLRIRAVDNSPECSWWKELQEERSNEATTVATDIKAGVPFTLEKDIVFDYAMEGTALILSVNYDYDPETNGPGPATILLVRD